MARLASQLTAVNARLEMELSERRRLEEERSLTTQRMEALLALTHMTDQPADEIVARVVEDAIRLTRSAIGYLAVLDDDESVLTMRYWSKSAHAACKVVNKPIIYPLEKTGLWGEAVRQRQPVITNDYAAPNPCKHGMPEGHVPVVRHMNIPVFDGERIVAVAGVGNKTTDYDEGDVRQLQLLMDGWWRTVIHQRFTQSLATARDQAEAANQAKSRFLATMSHEIRTPMTAILGYGQLMTDPALSASDRNNYLAVISRNGEHLLSLINDILDLSKIEAGKIAVDMRPCNLLSLLADVAGLVRPRALEHDLHLTVEYAGQLPKTILTDAARLQQAIVNLAGNAVKFTERGDVRIVASFLPAWRDGEPAVQIEVIDTGIGIHPEVLPQLFQPFTQADASVSRKFGGTGLGLAISRHIGQLLGGELTATSVWKQGSTFRLIVPTGSLEGVEMLGRPAEAGLHAGQPIEKSTSGGIQGVHVLLAEDGLDTQRLIQAIFRRAGAQVEAVENGRLAVAKAESEPFDVILMDMNMPEMDGYQATRLLRDRGYARPILALTANAMSDDRDRCLAAGCNEYLSKPINQARLIQLIAGHAGTPRTETRPPNGDAGRPAAPDAAESQTSGWGGRCTVAPALPGTAKTAPSADGDAAISQYADDPDIAEILGSFVARLAAQIDAMREEHRAGRHEDLQRLAHKLKGAGGSYGYPYLTELCRTLEEAAKTRDAAAEAASLDAVAALVQAIQQGYRPLACTETISS